MNNSKTGKHHSVEFNHSDINQELEPKSEEEPIVIVCAADNNYSMPLAVTMRSAIENLKDNCKIFFYIIDGGIDPFNRQKILNSLIPGKCEIEFIKISDSLIDSITKAHDNLKTELTTSRPEHVSITSFYRLLIPNLLPKQLEKVIYLDCDLVIMGDLSQLWQIDFGENYILAVRDTYAPFVSSPEAQLNCAVLGINPDSPYFNAGVLSIDLKKLRADKFSTKAITYFTQNLDYIGFYDQGILNALLVGKWGQLDPKWNFNVTSFYDHSSERYKPWANSGSFYSEGIYNELVSNPYILHFVSVNKPWISRFCPQKEDFFECVDRTRWSGWRITIWRRLWRKLIPARSKSIDWL